MRTVELESRVERGFVPHLLSDGFLRSFHGESASCGPWDERGSRCIEFDADSGGSPLSFLGGLVRARVEQHSDRRTYVRNCVSFPAAPLVTVRSTWRVSSGSLRAQAEIRSCLPPPLGWLVESFVAGRARAQMAECVRAIQRDLAARAAPALERRGDAHCDRPQTI